MIARRIAASVFLLLALAGCAVGPDFERPAAPADDAYGKGPAVVPASATTGAQAIATERDIPADWWTVFGSESLSALVEEGLRANPDVKAAEASLRVANETLASARTALFPSLSGSFSATRQKNATGVLSPTLNQDIPLFNLYTGQLSITYPLDVFGGERRTIEAQEAMTAQQRFETEAARLTLSSNIVAAAIQEASLRGQIAAQEETIRLAEALLVTLNKQLQFGQIAGVDVAQQESQLAQARLALPPLRKQLEQQRDALAVLTGRTPGEDPAATFTLDALRLPAALPLSLPSKLVAQRPDIRASEENFHAACAEVGVAIANQLPQITLSGNLGTTATAINDLFKPGTGFWSIGGELAQTLFDAGSLLHKRRAADAALEQAAAQYRSTVLGALRDVADALHALEEDRNALVAAEAAEAAALRTVNIVQRQAALGQVAPTQALIAQQTLLQARIAAVQARAARYADTAALFQALGGGWWNRPGDGAQG